MYLPDISLRLRNMPCQHRMVCLFWCFLHRRAAFFVKQSAPHRVGIAIINLLCAVKNLAPVLHYCHLPKAATLLKECLPLMRFISVIIRVYHHMSPKKRTVEKIASEVVFVCISGKKRPGPRFDAASVVFYSLSKTRSAKIA